MGKVGDLMSKAKGAVTDVKAHWNEPAKGKYISYKEFASYSVGGIGVNTINTLFFTYAPLTASCVLLGSIYEIQPTHLAFLGVLVGILNLIKTPLISMLVDNTNSKMGKFRPYLLYTGLPTAIVLNLMVFIPVDADYNLRLIAVGLLSALLSMLQSVFAFAFTSLGQVMTPNSDERTTLLSISSFVYNLGPSVVNILFPILAGVLGGEEGMRNIRSYRILFPAFTILAIVMSIPAILGTREKIIVSKKYVAKVPFMKGIREVGKNKYFWLINLSQMLGGLKSGIYVATTWYCLYVLRSEVTLGVMGAVIGTASVPLMLLAPVLSKRFGKRNMMIFTDLLHALFIALMVFFLDQTVFFFVFMYLNTLMMGADAILYQSMTADVFDYQQWKTGKRLEGFIAQFGGMLITVAGMLSGLILPFIYESYGLVQDYDVLFNPEVRNPIFTALIVSSVISSVLAIIPILFYDMTEEKQKRYIEDLKERKLAEDEALES